MSSAHSAVELAYKSASSVVDEPAPSVNIELRHDSLPYIAGRNDIPASVSNLLEMAQTHVKMFVSVKVQCTESDFTCNMANAAGSSCVGSGTEHNTTLSKPSIPFNMLTLFHIHHSTQTLLVVLS